MTTIEQNKAIIREFIDRLFTKGDLGAVDDLLAVDFVNHDPPFGAPSDREGMRGAGAMFRAAFPDWHSDLGLLIGEGDLVVRSASGAGESSPQRSSPTDTDSSQPSGLIVDEATAGAEFGEHISGEHPGFP